MALELPIEDKARDGARPTEFLLLIAAFLGLFWLAAISGAFPGLGQQIYGPDSYMRLLRIEALLDGGSWYDSRIVRSNAPHGETLHWTRLFDIYLIALAAPFLAFLESRDALLQAGVLASPVWRLIGLAAMLWILKDLVPAGRRFVPALAFLMPFGLFSYYLPGRADHHAMTLALFLISLGLLLKLLARPEKSVLAVLLGIVLGLGVWNGPEFLLVAGCCLAAPGLAWVAGAPRLLASLPAIAFGGLGTIGIALIIERPIPEIFSLEYDRLSIAHVLVFALVFGLASCLLAGLRLSESRDHGGPNRSDAGSNGPSFGLRLLLAFGTAALGAVLLALFLPDFYRGPLAAVDPLLKSVWLERVYEMRPIWPQEGSGWSGLATFTALPVLALITAPWMLRHCRGDERHAQVFLFACLLLFTLLALRHFRLLPYAETLAILALAKPFGLADAWLAAKRSLFLRSLGRAFLVLVFLFGSLFAGKVVERLQSPNGAGQAKADRGACSLDPILASLNALADPEGSGAAVIMAHINHGPQLLFETAHHVIATPYHRNTAGILEGYRVFAATDPDAAHEILRKRGVDYLLVCDHPQETGYYASQSGDQSLHETLASETPPAWARPLPLAASSESPYRLYGLIDSNSL